jgi:hypothetical protein
MLTLTDETGNKVQLNKEEMEIIMDGVRDRQFALNMFSDIAQSQVTYDILKKLSTLDY